MLNIIICDDSLLDNKFLEQVIKDIEKELKIFCNIHSFYSPDKLLATIEKINYQVDLAFLDIIMNPMNGIELATYLREKQLNMDIVFISGSKEYALESYQVQAKNYLLKPYKRNNIKAILQECIHDKVKKNEKDSKPIFLKNSKKTFLVYENEIKYVASEGKYIEVYTTSQGSIKLKMKLNEFNTLLKGKYFLKPHRSFIVNLDYIKSIEKYHFKLYTGEEIDIKQKEYNRFKDIWELYILDKIKKSDITNS